MSHRNRSKTTFQSASPEAGRRRSNDCIPSRMYDTSKIVVLTFIYSIHGNLYLSASIYIAMAWRISAEFFIFKSWLSRHLSITLKIFLPLLLAFGVKTYIFKSLKGKSITENSHNSLFLARTMEEFVWQEMNNELDGQYDMEPLKELCRRRNYQPGLIISCLAPAGGMGNVRNIILNCIRFALEGGGEYPRPRHQT